MKEIKVMVVDDSPFSVAMLSNMLAQNGFNVVGSADGLESAVEGVKALAPEVVTMDMTMPDADGIACTRAIHKINPDVKVVIVSSMMDDEIIQKAKKAKIHGYIQKPVDAEELTLLINRIMADEELFAELNSEYPDCFKEVLKDTMNKLFKSIPAFESETAVNSEQVSRGISVVIGISGKYTGRMILDMSIETARNIAQKMLKLESPDKDLIVNMTGEMANIIAGNGCSLLNKTNKLLGLRVTPPTMVYGEYIKILKTDLDTSFSVVAQTEYGELFLNAGFNRSEI